MINERQVADCSRCENCRWCELDKKKLYYCVNPNSDQCGEYVDAELVCDKWKQKNDYSRWKK